MNPCQRSSIFRGTKYHWCKRQLKIVKAEDGGGGRSEGQEWKADRDRILEILVGNATKLEFDLLDNDKPPSIFKQVRKIGCLF